MNELDLNQIKNLIKLRTGLVCDKSLTTVLQEEIKKKIIETGIGSIVDYYKVLVNNQEEFLKLVNLITVNETYFFRESAYIDILVDQIIPRLMNLQNPFIKKIKILSAGCSTGEEPYSIAIALHKKYGHGFKYLFDIIGFDIDQYAIQRAKEGIFFKPSFRSVDSELVNCYFERMDENRMRIIDLIRNSVIFINLNLTHDAYPEDIQQADVIFYRNVSIYFEPETQKKIFINLSKLLNENGYLIVSSTETLSHNYKILQLIEINGYFLFQKSNYRSDKLELLNDSPQFHEKPKVRQKLPSKQPTQLPFNDKQKITIPFQKQSIPPLPSTEKDRFEEAKSKVKLKKYDNALEIINNILKENVSFSDGYLLRSFILLNTRQLEFAKSDCLRAIELNPLSMEGYFLLGLIEKYQNNYQEALNQFKKSLYIHPTNWLAHFYMAEIYQNLNDKKNAIREYQIVKNLIENGQFHHHGLTIIQPIFSEKDILNVCNYNILRS